MFMRDSDHKYHPIMAYGLMMVVGVLAFILSSNSLYAANDLQVVKNGRQPVNYGKVDQPTQGEIPPNDLPYNLETGSSSRDVVTFRTDSGPELDWYQPCNGGDNLINFHIDVYGIDLAAISSATLTLAVWDVDFACGGACGGLCERDTVYINGHRLLTPQPYLTGADGQWSAVTFNVEPAWIAEGGNYIEIYIDTLSGSCWCVTCDWGELAIDVELAPEIEEIVINPVNPTTTKDVSFGAHMSDMTGYEVVEISWSGDIKSGTGNPYSVKPAGGTHGESKQVTAMLTYRNTATGEIGTASKSKEFQLFFDKRGDDGWFGFLRPDNWFRYWKSDRDGACSFGPDAAFSYKHGGGQYTTGGLQGWTYSGTGKIWLANPSTTTSRTYYNNNGLIIDRTRYKGIDFVEFVISHEKTHNHVAWNWESPNGQWHGMDDSDSDKIPDDVEATVPGFDPNNPKSHPTYPVSGGEEDEVYCDYIAFTANNLGNSSNDWANPGKQTNPAGYCYEDPGATANEAVLGDTFSDFGVDLNGDGSYDELEVQVLVIASVAGKYWLQGNLRVAEEIMLSDSGLFDLNVGPNMVGLRFSGEKLRLARVDGSYALEFLFLGGHAMLDDRQDAYLTSAYSSTQFQPMGLEFEGSILEEVEDTDGDGQYNLLRCTVPTNCYSNGAAQVEGWLQDSSGKEIGYAKVLFDASIGVPVDVGLEFDGNVICQSRSNGPYYLKYLVSELDGVRQDALHEAHVTSAYNWNEFEQGEGVFTEPLTFTDLGIDLDSNGLYDILRLEASVEISLAGEYASLGRLFDSNGRAICDAKAQLELHEGVQTLTLDIPGDAIGRHAVDGPYELRYVYLYHNGLLVDSLTNAYSTAAYEFTEFERPVVAITGEYEDYGMDTDGDGLFEYLTVELGAVASNAGNFAINARLMDLNETEIVWASTTRWLSADQPEMVQLTFAGTSIYENAVDGPYRVLDLYIYNIGDPSQTDYVYSAHFTEPYPYWRFGNYPPIAEAGGPYQGEPGEEITFDASESFDPDGAIELYQWDWESDGNYDAESSSPTITKIWDDSYSGTVTLQVTDDVGLTGIDVADVEVAISAAPIAVDVMPGQCPNVLEYADTVRCYVEVVILGSVDFDVRNINYSTIRLLGVEPYDLWKSDRSTPVVNPSDPCECNADGPDGNEDLYLLFYPDEIIDALENFVWGEQLELTLTAELSDGTAVQGEDCLAFVDEQP